LDIGHKDLLKFWLILSNDPIAFSARERFNPDMLHMEGVMTTDQVERLTEQEAASPDARRFVSTLPVQTQDAKPIRDMLATDHTDRESPVIRMALIGLTGLAFVAILAVMAFMTWATFTGS
jgi:hypothetical protein